MDELKEKIETLLYEDAPDFKIAQLIKEDLNNYYKNLKETFIKSGGKDFLVKHTKKIDSIIKSIYKIATRELFKNYFPGTNPTPIALIALGSYGREQLSPYSDIDLMILYKDIKGFNTKELIEKILYLMWDSKIKLAHRVHEVGELFEVSKEDITIKSALLESRFIIGSHFLWTEANNQLSQIRSYKVEEFISQKLLERKKLHQKFPLTMEPNIKEGVGGIRDANFVFWVGKVLYNVPAIKELPSTIIDYKDYSSFRSSLEFLFKVRAALHLSASKKEDRLLLEYIPSVSRLLGYEDNYISHMKFSKKVINSLKNVWLYTRYWLTLLTAQHSIDIYKDYFNPPLKEKNIKEIIKLLINKGSDKFRAHPKLLKAIIDTTKDKKSQKDRKLQKDEYPLIWKIFNTNHSASIFNAFSESSKLDFLIPPLKKVISLPQFDGYHNYSVDIHSLKSLEHLENIEDENLKEIYNNLSQREKVLIKCATFLHDSGKGRKMDHHEVGARLFKVFAPKIGLNEEETQLGAKLIKYHTLMSKTAREEDIYNPKTINQFASIFPNKKELDLIYLLTYSDLKGVGKDIYTPFIAKLLETLYKNAQEALEHKEYLSETNIRVNRIQKIKRSSIYKEAPLKIKKKILEIESNLPFIRYSTQRIFDITKWALDLEREYEYKITNKRFLTIEIIRKTSLDLGFLLSKLSRLNVINMEIVKLFNNIKYFKIDFNEKVTQEDILEIEQIIKQSFLTNLKYKIPNIELKKEEIFIDCDHSKEYAQMKIDAKDQRGLLASIMSIFEELKIEITSAKISTIKKRAKDIFLIEKNGNFCNNIEKIYQSLIRN